MDTPLQPNEFALTPTEKDKLGEASDLLDAVGSTDPRVKRAHEIVDGVIADTEGDG